MTDVSDILTVSFDSGLKDESALCVTRKYGEKIIMLKMELGEQADILYHLLTEQMTKAEIKTDRKVIEDIKAEIEKVFCMSVVTNKLRTPMEVKSEILQIIDKHIGADMRGKENDG